MEHGLPEHYLSPRPAVNRNEDSAVDYDSSAAVDDESGRGIDSELSFSAEVEERPRTAGQAATDLGRRRAAEGAGSDSTLGARPRASGRRLVGIFGHDTRISGRGDGAVSPSVVSQPRPASDGRQLPRTDAAQTEASRPSGWDERESGPRPDGGDGQAEPEPATAVRPGGRRRWRRPPPAGWCSDESNPAADAAARSWPIVTEDASSIESEHTGVVVAATGSRGTSPSVMSASSVASRGRLEWDAAADVGYSAAYQAPLQPADSLSTLERIAIGSYAGVLRAEPDGRPRAPTSGGGAVRRRRHAPLLSRQSHAQETIAEEAERLARVASEHSQSPKRSPSGDGRSAGTRPRRRSRDGVSRQLRPPRRRRSGDRGTTRSRRDRPVSAGIQQRRASTTVRLAGKKSSSLSELSASPIAPRRRAVECSAHATRFLRTSPCSDATEPKSETRSEDKHSNALFFTSADTLVALPGTVALPFSLSDVETPAHTSTTPFSSPDSSLPLSGRSVNKKNISQSKDGLSSEQTSKQSLQTVIHVSEAAEKDTCAGAGPPDSDRSAAAGTAASGASTLDKFPIRDTPAAVAASAVTNMAMSCMETSEGSMYSSLHAAGTGTGFMASTARESFGEFGVSTGLTGSYPSAVGHGSGVALYSEMNTRTRMDTAGRQVTETVKRTNVDTDGDASYKDVYEETCTETQEGGSAETEGLGDMSDNEAESRVRGLYQRLRGANHYRSLPTLGASPRVTTQEVFRARRPVLHFPPEECTISEVHTELTTKLATVEDKLGDSELCDLNKYVDFIGTACLDAEDEQVKRRMAEKVMRLLLQHQQSTDGQVESEPQQSDSSQLADDVTSTEPAPSRLQYGSRRARRLPSLLAGGRSSTSELQQSGGSHGGWHPPHETGRGAGDLRPVCSRTESETHSEADRRSAHHPDGGDVWRPAQSRAQLETRGVVDVPCRQPSGPLETSDAAAPRHDWRHQLTRSERRLAASREALLSEDSAGAAWSSHLRRRSSESAQPRRQTEDTTSSDYDFSTIRSRQRRLEDATASSFEYYDHERPHRSSDQSSLNAAGSAPVDADAEVTGVPSCDSAATPQVEPNPWLGQQEATESVAGQRVVHRHEVRTRRTVHPTSSSSAGVLVHRHVSRSRSGSQGRSSSRLVSGESSQQLATVVGKHKQKHILRLQREIRKLGQLERLLMGGGTVEVDISSDELCPPAAPCTPNNDGSEHEHAGSDGRLGVEGRSSHSDAPRSDRYQPTSTGFSRMRATLQRRREQIVSKLAEMDRRHRGYEDRISGALPVTERKSQQLLDETDDDVEDGGGRHSGSSSRGRSSRRVVVSTSSRRRVPASGSKTSGSRRQTTETSSQHTQTTLRRRRVGARGDGSVHVHTRRKLVESTETEDASEAAQVIVTTRRYPELSSPTEDASIQDFNCLRGTDTCSRSGSRTPAEDAAVHVHERREKVACSQTDASVQVITRRARAGSARACSATEDGSVHVYERRGKLGSSEAEDACVQVHTRRRAVAECSSAQSGPAVPTFTTHTTRRRRVAESAQSDPPASLTNVHEHVRRFRVSNSNVATQTDLCPTSSNSIPHQSHSAASPTRVETMRRRRLIKSADTPHKVIASGPPRSRSVATMPKRQEVVLRHKVATLPPEGDEAPQHFPGVSRQVMTSRRRVSNIEVETQFQPEPVPPVTRQEVVRRRRTPAPTRAATRTPTPPNHKGATQRETTVKRGLSPVSGMSAASEGMHSAPSYSRLETALSGRVPSTAEPTASSMNFDDMQDVRSRSELAAQRARQLVEEADQPETGSESSAECSREDLLRHAEHVMLKGQRMLSTGTGVTATSSGSTETQAPTGSRSASTEQRDDGGLLGALSRMMAPPYGDDSSTALSGPTTIAGEPRSTATGSGSGAAPTTTGTGSAAPMQRDLRAVAESTEPSTSAGGAESTEVSVSTTRLSSQVGRHWRRAGPTQRPCPDTRRARDILDRAVREGELREALYKADFCQVYPSCPASPSPGADHVARARGARATSSTVSVLTQTGEPCGPHGDTAEGEAGKTYRETTTRRQVHSARSMEMLHPRAPPTARRSIAYFLAVRNEPPPSPQPEEPCARVLPAVRLSQELLRAEGGGLALCADCAECGVSAGDECLHQRRAATADGRAISTLTRRTPAGRPLAAECVTLQEALQRRRPDFVQNAGVRQQYLQRLGQLRRVNLERAARAARQLPDLPTRRDWQLFSQALKPEVVQRAFDYRDMRQHTERLWRRLPEIRDCVTQHKRHEQFRTNRLMWQVYRRKLQERCLRGDVHLTHRDAILASQ